MCDQLHRLPCHEANWPHSTSFLVCPKVTIRVRGFLTLRRITSITRITVARGPRARVTSGPVVSTWSTPKPRGITVGEISPEIAFGMDNYSCTQQRNYESEF